MTQFTQNTVFDYNMERAWELCTPLHVLLTGPMTELKCLKLRRWTIPSGDTTVILHNDKHNTISSCCIWFKWIMDYGQKEYWLDSKTLKNDVKGIGMAKKSRNKNHSNKFYIKFIPWLACFYVWNLCSSINDAKNKNGSNHKPHTSPPPPPPSDAHTHI